MSRLEPPVRFRTVFSIVAFSLLVPTASFANPVTHVSGSKESVRVDCILPDGEHSTIPDAENSNHATVASVIDNETVSCALPEGETTFIIAVPKNFLWDRFTFLNENVAASGELRIAVSNSPLPANSPEWKQVDGIVPFAHKRLFNLSLLGIDTKFVRLSFHVESSSAANTNPGRHLTITQNMFDRSALADAISSRFAGLGTRSEEINFASISVAPLAIVSKK
jgi:hypothetical protein